MELIRPTAENLGSYRAGLVRSLQEGAEKNPEYVEDQLKKIAEDPVKFITFQEDPEAQGGDVPLPDGSFVPRLPGFSRWLWDGQVCGSINFRWQQGTTELPEYCLGHIGYDVFGWKRGRGYATQALRQILLEAAQTGLAFVELVTDPGNHASQKVILANGGVLYEKFTVVESRGGGEAWRYRISF